MDKSSSRGREREGEVEKSKNCLDGFISKSLVTCENEIQVNFAGKFFDKSEWLTTKEAAIYLRKFLASGVPSANAIHKLVAKGAIQRRKFAGRLFFRKKELDFLIESSVI